MLLSFLLFLLLLPLQEILDALGSRLDGGFLGLNDGIEELLESWVLSLLKLDFQDAMLALDLFQPQNTIFSPFSLLFLGRSYNLVQISLILQIVLFVSDYFVDAGDLLVLLVHELAQVEVLKVDLLVQPLQDLVRLALLLVLRVVVLSNQRLAHQLLALLFLQQLPRDVLVHIPEAVA